MAADLRDVTKVSHASSPPLERHILVILHLAAGVVLRCLRCVGRVVALLVLFASLERFYAVTDDLIGGALVAVLILVLADGQHTGHGDQITLLGVAAQELSALPPCHTLDPVGGVLGAGAAHSQRKGGHGYALSGLAQLDVSAQSAGDNNVIDKSFLLFLVTLSYVESGMFFVCHKLQVLKSVVAPVVVDVVDYLIFCEMPPDVFLHHQPMLHHQPIAPP